MDNIAWDIEKHEGRRDRNHPVILDCYQRKARLLDDLQNVGSCLELGAGEGFWTRELTKRFTVTVADQAESFFKDNPCSDKKIFSLPEIPFKDNSFDLVFEANVLHHLDKDKKAVEEMIRVSSKYIIIVEPNRYHPLTVLLGLILPHERKSLLFSRAYVEKMTEGLPVKLLSSFTQGTLPPNKTPFWFWRIFRNTDRRLPFLGLENFFVYEKVGASNEGR